MPRRIISNSFVSGEISPELHGRHDLKAYFNGAASIENFIVRRTGGIRKRAGTEMLYELDASASPDDGTLDNKFKAFPYFYDSSSFGLLVFRITDEGVPQSKLIVRSSGSSSIGEWSGFDINTGITTTAELDDLICKQVGDTLFFTRPGNQAFTCKIDMDDESTEFSTLDNSTTIQPPAAITATPANFYKDGEGAARGIQKHYALFGVKDGVMSKPAAISTPASTAAVAGTCTPWTSGATVAVRGTLDFSLHDYYVLAKKTGMNYGKLSEIYPVEQISASSPVVSSSDMAFRAADAAYSDSNSGIFSGSPDALSTDKQTISLTRKCMALKATATTVGGTTKYRVVTPHYLIDFGTSSAKYANLFLRPSATRLDTLSEIEAGMKNQTISVTPFHYSADGSGSISIGNPFSSVADNNGHIAAIPCGSLSGERRFGMIVEWTGTSKSTDCLFVGGLFATNLNYLTSKMVFLEASDAVLSAPEALSSDPSYETTISEPTLFGKIKHGTPAVDVICTTAWNDHSPILAYLTTWDEMIYALVRTKTDMTIASDLEFNVNGAMLSEITFTLPASANKISSLLLHLGTKSIDWRTGAAVAMPSQSYVDATLSAIDGTTESTVGTFSVKTGFIESKKLSVSYPDDVEAATTYKLTFSAPVRIRGISVNSINETLEFIDDNIIPGAITGQQDMIKVGDVNMDCALFDVFQQRSVFASSEELPFSLWFSVAGDLYNFYALRPQADDDAFTVTIPATMASKIRHILASKELMLFTEDGVYVVDAAGDSGFSYRTIRMKKICNSAASSSVAPIQTDGKTLFVGEDGRTVYELKYDLMEDSFAPSDRSILAYHLTETAKIVKMAYQRFPDSVIWFLMDDGNLASMTYMPEHEIWAWSHHSFAENASRQKIVDIISVGSLVTGDGLETTSDVLLIFETLKSDLSRDSKTIIERMRPNICADVLVLGQDNNECTDHLGGQYPASVAAKLVTLRPESPEASTQGIPKRVVDVCLRIRRSGKISVKPYEPNIPAMSLDNSTENAGDVTLTLFTGDMQIAPYGYVNGDGQIQIESADEKPCEILSVVYELELP